MHGKTVLLAPYEDAFCSTIAYGTMQLRCGHDVQESTRTDLAWLSNPAQVGETDVCAFLVRVTP